MRRLLRLALALFLAAGLGMGWTAVGRAASWDQTAEKVQDRSRAAVQEAAVTETLIAEERKKLEQELAALQAEIASKEKAMAQRKARFEALIDEEARTRSRLENEQTEVKALEGAIRVGTKDVETLLRTGLIGPELPGWKDTVNGLLDTTRFPDLSEIKALGDLYFDYMTASAEIRGRDGEIIDPQGRMVQARIVRLGAFTALYLTPGLRAGYLLPDVSGRRLVAAPGRVSWRQGCLLKRFIQDKTDHVPLDISRGAVFEQRVQRKNLKEWFLSGGVLVWPILFIGIVGLVLGLERIVQVTRVRGNTDRIADRLQELARQGQWQECRDLCKTHWALPTCRVLAAALDHLGETQEVLSNALQEAMLRELSSLERFLPTLSVLAAIAPLLGLLGTVTGMIETFQVITLYGTGDPRLMAGGISEALITTELGLAVAIPIMLLHHFLESRVEKVVGDMEEKGMAFTVTLLKEGAVTNGNGPEAKA